MEHIRRVGDAQGRAPVDFSGNQYKAADALGTSSRRLLPFYI